MDDAIVVGARCAGSAIAMLLTRRGYMVLLVDRATFPSDMPMSTHFIHQRGIACLTRWGLRDEIVATQNYPVTRVELEMGRFALAGTAPPVDGETSAFAPRRILLDEILVRAATNSGAELREGCRVTELLYEDGRVAGVKGFTRSRAAFSEKAHIVVGADGPSSRVAAEVKAAEYNTIPTLEGTAWTYWNDVRVEPLITGAVSPSQFYAPENIERILKRGTARENGHL